MTREEIEQQLLITIKELKEERTFLYSEIERLREEIAKWEIGT
jgi:uncharacterized small protein (DUF1192 family)